MTTKVAVKVPSVLFSDSSRTERAKAYVASVGSSDSTQVVLTLAFLQAASLARAIIESGKGAEETAKKMAVVAKRMNDINTLMNSMAPDAEKQTTLKDRYGAATRLLAEKFSKHADVVANKILPLYRKHPVTKNPAAAAGTKTPGRRNNTIPMAADSNAVKAWMKSKEMAEKTCYFDEFIVRIMPWVVTSAAVTGKSPGYEQLLIPYARHLVLASKKTIWDSGTLTNWAVATTDVLKNREDKWTADATKTTTIVLSWQASPRYIIHRAKQAKGALEAINEMSLRQGVVLEPVSEALMTEIRGIASQLGS